MDIIEIENTNDGIVGSLATPLSIATTCNVALDTNMIFDMGNQNVAQANTQLVRNIEGYLRFSRARTTVIIKMIAMLGSSTSEKFNFKDSKAKI